MKIFLSFLQSKIQHPIPAYNFWEYYIKNGITETGFQYIECDDVDWAQGLVQQSDQEFQDWKSFTWSRVLKQIKEQGADLFLSYLYPQQIDESAVRELKKMGVFCVNFFCDHVRLYRSVPKAFHVFDLNWVPEYKAIKFYQKARLNYLNLPMPMWVEPKYRSFNNIENNQVSFIGSKDIQRHLLFYTLIKHNPERIINIYGKDWLNNDRLSSIPASSARQKILNQLAFIGQNGFYAFANKIRSRSYKAPSSLALNSFFKGKPDFENYIKITKESNITIGVNRYPSFNYPLQKPNTYSRLRDIEAPMLGACYLTEWTEGIDELYETGKEIVTYTSAEELDEQCSRLLADEKMRMQLREAGQKRALSDHSISASIQKIIEHIT
ncbi:glycosyltransferase family protein [Pedobacter sp. GSP4]|uniref:glycosyltransferase family protein n=1 Tax=Pedobacter sp. GSP4 TaxID=3453716 RepID=UPI003EEBF288